MEFFKSLNQKVIFLLKGINEKKLYDNINFYIES